MKTRLHIAMVALATMLVLPNLASANCGNCGPEGKGHMHHGKHAQAMQQCMGGCPMAVEGADVKVENTKNGVKIEITSKDAAIVKAIQAKAVKCAEPGMKAQADKDDMVTCPVMGTTFPKSKAVATREYNGKTYYLCCNACIGAWDKDPGKYAK